MQIRIEFFSKDRSCRGMLVCVAIPTLIPAPSHTPPQAAIKDTLSLSAAWEKSYTLTRASGGLVAKLQFNVYLRMSFGPHRRLLAYDDASRSCR